MLAALLVAATLEGGTFVARAVEVDGATHRYQVWLPRGFDATKKWPAILFLHGSGERGSDNQKQISVGLGPALLNGTVAVPAVVIFPQCPEEGYWTAPERKIAMAALDAAMLEFSVDPRRVTMTGMSMGGAGTWVLAAEHPDRFAAIAPVCGFLEKPPGIKPIRNPAPWLVNASDPYEEVVKRLPRIPIWIFHGALDTLVPPQESREMIARLGSNAAYTEFARANHNAWDPTYSGTTVVAWLARQVRPRSIVHDDRSQMRRP
jgi:predicted peptidase